MEDKAELDRIDALNKRCMNDRVYINPDGELIYCEYRFCVPSISDPSNSDHYYVIDWRFGTWCRKEDGLEAMAKEKNWELIKPPLEKGKGKGYCFGKSKGRGYWLRNSVQKRKRVGGLDYGLINGKLVGWSGK